MKRWISAAVVAGVLAVTVPALTQAAAAAPREVTKQRVDAARATDFSAQRYYRRYQPYGPRVYYRPNYRPYYQPYYYARPYAYRPYPYVAPAPFTFGFGFGPYW